MIIVDNYSGDDSHRKQFWAEYSSKYLHICHQGRRSVVIVMSFQTKILLMVVTQASYHHLSLLIYFVNIFHFHNILDPVQQPMVITNSAQSDFESKQILFVISLAWFMLCLNTIWVFLDLKILYWMFCDILYFHQNMCVISVDTKNNMLPIKCVFLFE